jgi:hypothetical protein
LDIDEWFLGTIDNIEAVILSRVDQVSTKRELEDIKNQEAPEGFRRVSAMFKGRLRGEAEERIAAATKRVEAAIALKETNSKV